MGQNNPILKQVELGKIAIKSHGSRVSAHKIIVKEAYCMYIDIDMFLETVLVSLKIDLSLFLWGSAISSLMPSVW